MAAFAEDAEWHPYLGQVGGGVRRGAREIEEMLREIDVDLDLTLEPEEFVDLDDCVLVPLRSGGTGKESGLSVDARWCQLWSLRDAQVIKVTAYPDQASALGAAQGDAG